MTELPDAVADAMARMAAQADEVRTRAIRLQHASLGPLDKITADELAAAARHPAAPDELRTVARLVSEKKLTWEQVASGDNRTCPEFAELQRAALAEFSTELLTPPDPAPRQEVDEDEDDEIRIAWRDTW